jgi:hypothetical protein
VTKIVLAMTKNVNIDQKGPHQQLLSLSIENAKTYNCLIFNESLKISQGLDCRGMVFVYALRRYRWIRNKKPKIEEGR